MSALDELINRVVDSSLRERLRTEANRLTNKKNFGLVFEEHLPELTPIYSVEVRKGCKVAFRNEFVV